jgi:ATP-binding cassette, subfamily G (WHITE), member 2, PDR
MAQLRQDASSFFTFLLFGFTCTLSMSMIFRTVAQMTRTIHEALTPVSLFILVLVVHTGFILPRPNMQGWLRWISYVNPMAYAFESIMANEFAGRQFPCVQFIPPYPDLSPAERTCAVPGARPGEDFVDGDVFINGSFGYFESHMWRLVPIPSASNGMRSS